MLAPQTRNCCVETRGSSHSHVGSIFQFPKLFHILIKETCLIFPPLLEISEKDVHGHLTIHLRKRPGILSLLVTALPPAQGPLRPGARTRVSGVCTSFRPGPRRVGSRVPDSEAQVRTHRLHAEPARGVGFHGGPRAAPQRWACCSRGRATVSSNE